MQNNVSKTDKLHIRNCHYKTGIFKACISNYLTLGYWQRKVYIFWWIYMLLMGFWQLKVIWACSILCYCLTTSLYQNDNYVSGAVNELCGRWCKMVYKGMLMNIQSQWQNCPKIGKAFHNIMRLNHPYVFSNAFSASFCEWCLLLMKQKVNIQHPYVAILAAAKICFSS